MRIPLSWLRDFVDVPWGAKELGSRLTMSGFELEASETAAPKFSGVVVAEIVEAAKHPQAEKLQVCKVRAGGATAADRLRRRECARRSQDRAGHRRRETTGRQGHHRRQAARRGIVRHVVLREGTGPGGHFRRHHRTAGRCARGHGPARLHAARRRHPRAERDPESWRRHVGAGHRAGSRGADSGGTSSARCRDFRPPAPCRTLSR